MTRSNRRNFSLDFKPEAAQLVLDQHYTVFAAATATVAAIMNVDKPIMDKWVSQINKSNELENPQKPHR